MDAFHKNCKHINTLLAQGNAQEGLRLAKELTNTDPNRVEGYLLAGKASFELMRYEETLRYLGLAEYYGSLDRESLRIKKQANNFLNKESQKEKSSPSHAKQRPHKGDSSHCCYNCDCCCYGGDCPAPSGSGCCHASSGSSCCTDASCCESASCCDAGSCCDCGAGCSC